VAFRKKTVLYNFTSVERKALAISEQASISRRSCPPGLTDASLVLNSYKEEVTFAVDLVRAEFSSGGVLYPLR
jgi:hypothetical protein